MVRWVRLALLGTTVLAILAVGVSAGLFLVANAGWVEVSVPPWMHSVFGEELVEIWLPALLAGWLLSTLLTTALLIGSMYAVWRRRQYEALVSQLERELTNLRNLPLDSPAPLEDLPESPNAQMGRILKQASQQISSLGDHTRSQRKDHDESIVAADSPHLEAGEL